MSFVSAAPPLLHGAAQDLAGIRSLLADATANISSPTTGIAAAAQDEISVAIASLFGNFGREFQSASAQAQSFHTQFVNVLNASAGAYLGAEVDAHRTLLANTAENAQTVFTASRAALGTLVNGVSTGFTQLATNPRRSSATCRRRHSPCSWSERRRMSRRR